MRKDKKGIKITSNTNIFHLIQTGTNSHARIGELVTPHGRVPTPVFSPVGSQATVKTMTPEELNIRIDMVVANTYHLYLRPGIGVIEKMGGLHTDPLVSPICFSDFAIISPFNTGKVPFLSPGNIPVKH